MYSYIYINIYCFSLYIYLFRYINDIYIKSNVSRSWMLDIHVKLYTILLCDLYQNCYARRSRRNNINAQIDHSSRRMFGHQNSLSPVEWKIRAYFVYECICSEG